MRFFKVIAALTSLLAFTSTLSAQEVKSDESFEVYDADAKAFYISLSESSATILDKASAEKLTQILFADGTISRREIGQLDQLRRTDLQQVFAVIDGASIPLPVANDEARSYINILFERVPLATLWSGSANEFQRLVDMRRMAPVVANNVDNFITSELLKTWKRSTIYNAYEPIRAELKERHDKAASLPGDYPEQFDELLYDSMIAIRDYYEERPTIDGPPPFIYNWLKPDRD